MSQENVESVRRVFEGWNRNDVEAWLESSHPEVEWYSAIGGLVEGSQGLYRGHAGIRRFWDEWHSVWEIDIEVAELRDLGDTVLVLGRMRARGKASGVDLDSPVAYVVKFEAGLVRTVRAYLEPQEALEAAGLAE